MRWVVGFGLALAICIALSLLAGCAHAPPVPGAIVGAGLPDNLRCVDHERDDGAGPCEVYASAQPSAAEFSMLTARFGLRSVLKLNSALEGRDHLPGSVEPYEHPWSPIGPVDHEDVAAALYDLEHAPRPTLVHCTHGIDRTGLLLALWRVLHEHRPASAAWAEWRATPRERTDALFYDAFERETGYHIPEDER